MPSKKCGKLVRDLIPEIIRKNDKMEPEIKILNDIDYKMELENKLTEEYQEVMESSNSKDRVEELADLLEVAFALAKVEGLTEEELLKEMINKRTKRGGFENRIYLIK